MIAYISKLRLNWSSSFLMVQIKVQHYLHFYHIYYYLDLVVMFNIIIKCNYKRMQCLKSFTFNFTLLHCRQQIPADHGNPQSTPKSCIWPK